jgi:hypothetical protein
MVATLVSLTAEAAAEQTKIAVFDFELVDTSLDGAVNGPRADEAARLARLAVELRNRLAASSRYAPLDISPVAGEAKASNLRACGACDRKLAQQLGAELAITGMVHKVSNLILSMSIHVRDVGTGRLVSQASADFRGNTDESWSRALDWLIRNRLLAAEGGAER